VKNYIVKEALKNDLFELYYQPKIDLKSKKVKSVEALIRIKNKDGSIIYPKEFLFDIANDDIIELDKWVFRQLIEDSRYISMMTLEKLNISFNVSSKSFLEDDFLENIGNIFRFTTDFNSIFEIEINEYSLVQDIDKSIKIMNTLKEMGFKLSLDDFGTRYASLSCLKEFPIDCIKIDKTFIDEIEANDKTTKIIESVIKLAKNLGLKTIAEGVEQTNQVVWLYENRCDEVQGYYYSKALPIAQFVKFTKAINQRKRENSFIVWSEKYSVGNYAFDTQHMIIASILNNLYKEIKENKEISDVKDYFELLDRYIKVHFQTEEELMLKAGYPDANAHIQMHRDWMQKSKVVFYEALNNQDSKMLLKVQFFLILS
jgi:hemerythrin-like metal-binding protein